MGLIFVKENQARANEVSMNTTAIKSEILEQLPFWIEEDPVFRVTLIRMLKNDFLPRIEADSRFNSLLNESRNHFNKALEGLRRDREATTKEFAKLHEKADREREATKQEFAKVHEDIRRYQEETTKEFAKLHEKADRDREATKQEFAKVHEEFAKLREDADRDREATKQEFAKLREDADRDREATKQEFAKLREDADRDREATKQEFAKVHEKADRDREATKKEFEKVHASINRLERTIGGLGARWGLQSERAFRNALAAILEKSFGVKVLNLIEYDDTGEVFGRPDQIEIDVIIHNGIVIVCEIKASIDRGDIYLFERKVRFYEKRHGQTVSRMIVISPMINEKARPVAAELGIEVYTDSADVSVEAKL